MEPPKPDKINLSGTLNTPNTTIIGNDPTHTTHTNINKTNIGKCQICGTEIDPKYHLCYKCLYNCIRNKQK
jgi:hypothetical protein